MTLLALIILGCFLYLCLFVYLDIEGMAREQMLNDGPWELENEIDLAESA